MVMCAIALLSILMTSLSSSASAQGDAAQLIVAGWIERISIPDQGLVFEAKLDTGADSSSVHGTNVDRFRRAGVSLVRFDIVDDTGKLARIEAPIVRRVRVKRSGSDGDSRPVVRLTVCVGGRMTDGEFTVADRADLKYQVLIGRNVLAGRILVDSGSLRLVSDKCALPR